jgi:hypothetical protein
LIGPYPGQGDIIANLYARKDEIANVPLTNRRVENTALGFHAPRQMKTVLFAWPQPFSLNLRAVSVC